MTVKELKDILKDIPDNWEVKIDPTEEGDSSDSYDEKKIVTFYKCESLYDDSKFFLCCGE